MNSTPERPFSSPEEEIRWLREQLETKTSPDQKESRPSREIIKETLKEAGDIPSHALGSYALTDDDVTKKRTDLDNEEHHDQIEELMAIASEKGILSALKVARALNNPHLLDDFHDRLIAELLFYDQQNQ